MDEFADSFQPGHSRSEPEQQSTRWATQPPFGLAEARDFLATTAEKLIGPRIRAQTNVSDIVQQSLLIAVRDQMQFRGKSVHELREWLTTILKNRVIDEARRLKAQKRSGAIVDTPVDQLQIALPQSGPASVAAAEEQISRLLDGIQALPELQRKVVQLRYIDGRSFEQIGEHLNLSHDSVRRLWLKALKQLGRYLGADETP